MTIRLTPEEKANLQEFWNRVDHQSKPYQHWQRVDLRPRLDIPLGWIVAAALGICFWAVVVLAFLWIAQARG